MPPKAALTLFRSVGHDITFEIVSAATTGDGNSPQVPADHVLLDFW